MNWDVIAAVVVSVAAWGFIHWLEGLRFQQREAAWQKQVAAYERAIDHQYSEIKDLRDRLFQSKAMAPSGVDLTEAYEERKKNEREHKERTGGKHVPPGPLERLTEKWKDKDLKAASAGLDYTESKNAN